jgi:CDP-paratose 2-epimerase
VRIGDVRDRAFLGTLPAADWILDCAANPSVLAGVDGSDTRDLIDQNLYGTINLLELCKKWTAGFILLSTSRVYSIPPLAGLPLHETLTRFEPDFQPPATDWAQPERPGFPEAQESHNQRVGLVDTPIPPVPSVAPASSPLCPPVPPVAKINISPSGVSESFPTSPPVSLYGATKLCSELLALEYGESFGFPVWINRCGVLAGAGQFGKADQGIFSYWIHSWRAGRPLKYIGFGGKGLQVRDCLHPKDLVPLLLKQMAACNGCSATAMLSKSTKEIRSDDSLLCSPVPPVANPSSPLCPPVPPVAKSSLPRIINVSGGLTNSMSLLELSHWCQSRFGPHPSSEYLVPSCASCGKSSREFRPFDIPWLVLDASLAKATWDWSPATPINDILEEIAQHAESNPDWLDLVT